MKINTFPFVITLLMSLLISYAFYAIDFGFQKSDQFKLLSSIIAFAFSSATLVFSFGATYEANRTGLVIRSFSIAYFIFGIFGLMLLKLFLLSIPLLVILSGIMILCYTLIVYFVFRANQ